MVTITRRLAQQLRAVLRRAFGTRAPGPALCFTVDPDTLSVRASSHDIAVEYRGPSGGNAGTLWLPFQFLVDCEAKKDEPVHVEVTGQGRATAQWRDGSVPQIVQYDTPEAAGPNQFPSLPETFAENPPYLLQALQAASDTTDPDSVRYALGYLQLCGASGTINATDGRQMLAQSGFQFPWTENLLVPSTKVFAAAQLPQDQPVGVGRSGNWVAVQVGQWTVWLAINTEGRYPDLSRHTPRPETAIARCRFSAADTRFLAENLGRLPCDETYNYPITVDLNGSIAIRAKAADQAQPTELVLSNSERSGEPLRLNINRKYLARAVKLGFRDLLLYGSDAALVCCDDRRHFVWMPLTPEQAIKPADGAIRIVSPVASDDTSIPTNPLKRRTQPLSEPITNRNGETPATSQAAGNGQAKTNGQARKTSRKAQQQDLAGLITQAEALRTALRESLLKTNELLKGLKQHRRQSRVLESTIASLRQLKTLGV